MLISDSLSNYLIYKYRKNVKNYIVRENFTFKLYGLKYAHASLAPLRVTTKIK